MARFDNSWRTDVKTMFAALPLNAIQLKLNQEQQERDVISAQLQGDFDMDWIPGSADVNKVKEIRDQYRADMDALQQTMSISPDLSDVTSQLQQIQRKYGLTPSQTLGYTTTGGGSSNGSGNTSGSMAGTGALYGTGISNAHYNNIGFQDAIKYYADQDDPNSKYYQYHHVDKKVRELYYNTEGDPTKQQMVVFQKQGVLDEQGLGDDLQTMANNMNKSGTSYVGDPGVQGYIATYHNTYISTNDAYDMIMGRLLNDNQWTELLTYKWEYNRDGSVAGSDYIDDAYADQYRDAELQRRMDKYNADNPDDKFNNTQEMLEYIYRQNNVSDNNSKENIDEWLAQQGYIYSESYIKAKPYIEEADFDDKTMTIQESWQNKAARNRAQAKYEHDLNMPDITYTGVSTDIDYNPDKKSMTQLATDYKTARNQATNANTTMNNSFAKSSISLFGASSNITSPFLLAQDMKQSSINATGQKLTQTVLSDAGLLTVNNDGTISVNVNDDGDLATWNNIVQTSNQDYTPVQSVGDLQLITQDYNTTVNNFNQAQQTLDDQQFKYSSNVFHFLNSDAGKEWIDEQYTKYNDAGGTLTKDDFKTQLIIGNDLIVREKNNASGWGWVVVSLASNGIINFQTDLVEAMDDFYKDDANRPNARTITTYNWNDGGTSDKNFYQFISSYQNSANASGSDFLQATTDLNGVNGMKLMGISSDNQRHYTYDYQFTPATMNGKKIAVLTVTATGDSSIKTKKRTIKRQMYIDIDQTPKYNGFDLSQAFTSTLFSQLNSYDQQTGNTNMATQGQDEIAAYNTIGALNCNKFYSDDGTIDYIQNMYNGNVGSNNSKLTAFSVAGVDYYFERDNDNVVMKYHNTMDNTTGFVTDDDGTIITVRNGDDAQVAAGKQFYYANSDGRYSNTYVTRSDMNSAF